MVAPGYSTPDREALSGCWGYALPSHHQAEEEELGYYFANLYLRETLPVATLHLVALTAFLLEYYNLVPFHVVEDFGLDHCASHRRSAHGNGVVMIYEEHLVKLHRIAYSASQPVNVNPLVLLNFELLPCYLYYYVHLDILYV